MADMDLRQTVLYGQVMPQAVQDTYTEFDNVDFVINVGEGRALLKNSVRVLADVLVTTDGAARPAAQSTLGWNRNAGAHSFFQSVQVSTQLSGLIENVQNYPRLVNMVSTASNDRLDLINSDRQCELRGHVDNSTNLWAQGYVPYVEANGTAPPIADFDFSLKPMCALNSMSGGDLASAKSGAITLSLNLAKNIDALRGGDQTATCDYKLSNLRCTFQSVLADPKAPPTGMRVTYNIKSNVLSGAATVSANVPALVSGVSISLIDTYEDSRLTYDSYALQRPLNIQEVQYLFNDQTNSLITYSITDQSEMLERFIDSLENTGHNQVSMDQFRANQGFALGLNFDGLVDLSQNRFTLQLTSDADSRPSNIYMYFHSVATI